MDLFEDLPEPGQTAGNGERSERTQTGTTKKGLGAVQKWSSNYNDVFADLPPPTTADYKERVKRKYEEENADPKVKKTAEVLYELQGCYAERKGEREEMQDRHVILDNYEKLIPQLHPSVSRLSFYAVFDGHGGSRASKYSSSHLHVNLAEKFPKVHVSQVDKEIKRILVEAFRKTDEDFLKEATKTKPSWKDGSTAIVVLAIHNTLYIANLGDSKAILCRFNREADKHIAIPLSKDHSPTDYAERMRIQKSGGNVHDGRVMGILEVSRSIGDGQYKALGITCVPDVKRCQMTDDDCFVLLACDGIWKVFSSEEVLEIVLSSVKQHKDGKSSKDIQETICYETACNRLVTEAVRKHSGDNVTVVIAAIKKSI